MLEMENVDTQEVDEAPGASVSEEVETLGLRAEDLVKRLNAERLRVAMLLAGVGAEKLERAMRLAVPECDENGEYIGESVAEEVAAVLKEFPELRQMGVQVMPRVGAMGGNAQAIDRIAEIFGNRG